MSDEHVSSINFDSLDRGVRFLTLKRPLTAEEVVDVGNALAANAHEIDDEDEEKSEFLSGYRSRMKKLKAERARILGEHDSQQRETDVQCEIGFDWKSGRKYIRRTDTGALINPEGEVINDDERQLQISGMNAAQIVNSHLDSTGEDSAIGETASEQPEQTNIGEENSDDDGALD